MFNVASTVSKFHPENHIFFEPAWSGEGFSIICPRLHILQTNLTFFQNIYVSGLNHMETLFEYLFKIEICSKKFRNFFTHFFSREAMWCGYVPVTEPFGRDRGQIGPGLFLFYCGPGCPHWPGRLLAWICASGRSPGRVLSAEMWWKFSSWFSYQHRDLLYYVSFAVKIVYSIQIL